MPESHDHDLPVELYTWIRVATLDLNESEQAWARGEMVARFLEEMERLTSGGATEWAAAEAILAVMGDPWQVKQAMRQKDAIPAEMIDRVFRGESEPPRPVTPLDKWLKAATGELCAEARERVRAEIEAHYEDARAAALEAGRSEEDAAREALKSLGPPKAAAKEFRKTYLTADEYNELLDLRKVRHPLRLAVIKLGLGGLGILFFLCRIPLAHWIDPDHGGMWADLLWVAYLPSTFLFNQGIRHLRADYLLRPESEKLERAYKRKLDLAFAAYLITGLIGVLIQEIFEGRSLITLINTVLIFLLIGAFALGYRRNDNYMAIRKMRKHLLMDTDKDPDAHA